MKKRIAILASGRGSNAEALYEAMEQGKILGEVVVVISDQAGAPVLAKAAQWDVPAFTIVRKDYASRDLFEEAMVAILQNYDVDIVALAGYMRLLSGTFIRPYQNKILNIHPALLPQFPGLHAQRQAVEAKAAISGCTVHFVDEGMDSGPIIGQREVPVYPDDTEETLSARILPEEHTLYVEMLALVCADKIEVRHGEVIRK